MVCGLMAQHKVGGHSWVDMGGLGSVGGVSPRGNNGVGGLHLPQPTLPHPGWARAWGSPLGALSALSLVFLGASW